GSPDPAPTCRSTSSRRWPSSSSSTAGVRMPPSANCRRQSAMACSRLNIMFLPQAGQDRMDLQPLIAVFFPGLASVFLERIIFPFPAIFTHRPARLDPALALHPVQDRVEHPVGPLELILGAGLDFLNDGVAVTVAVFEEGQDEGFSGRGDQVVADDAGSD